VDLGKVVIDGDLGQIDCGKAGAAPGVNLLDVVSMGRFGLTTQSAVNDSPLCFIDGRIGALIVRTDFLSTNIDSAQIGSITIGGSMGGLQFGHIKANGSIGAIKIGGELRGGNEDLTGTITSTGSIKSIFVGRDVLGRNGGPGSSTGSIIAAGDIGSVTIRGSLRGLEDIISSGKNSGVVSAGGDMGAVRILGDLVGSTIESIGTDNSMDFSGTVRAAGKIKSVFIGGSIIGGTDVSTIGSMKLSGAIAAGKNIGSVTVLGSIRGPSVNQTFTKILANVADTAVNGKLAGIGKIVVKGSVEYAEIQAGVVAPDFTGGANLDAQIGSVRVGLNWIASTITAGIAAIGSDTLALTSRIGPITIGGQVLGDFSGGTTFKFSAEEIVSLRIGGESIPLAKGARNDLIATPIGVTGDISVVEVL